MKKEVDKSIRIITCNVPVAYLNAIDRLISNDNQGGLYPSRSELIRVAVREFLLKELEIAKNYEQLNDKAEDQNLQINTAEEVKSALFLKKIITP